MRAIQFSQYGGPEVLTLVSDAAEPTAGPGEVRIRVHATAVNPFDSKVRSGMMAAGKELTGSVMLGLEASGVVDQVGPDVTGTAVGDAVFGLGSATYAEYAVLRAWAPKPERLSFAEAAALAVGGETALRVLGLLALEPGQVLLVHGAAGGVGQAIVGLGIAAGLRVIGTASEANHDLLRELGAEPVTYGDGLVSGVGRLSHDVAGIADAAGTQMTDLLAIAGSPDRIVTIANYAARDAGVRFSGGGGDARGALQRVSELAAEGKVAVRVARAFDLTEVAAAHQLSESRRAGGKIVLTVT
ncbi:MAG TPA: NADP-dependent oxidoreductase [Propionicimonas sp.]|jgi:NADPH:quinone reductase-like Zn-dependent oxidoreductase|uniref:NADP-dependent oxidoreductase n=1 Tax=Propionicimonas sp. TaxID=1955623 RepID=UPI002F3F573E